MIDESNNPLLDEILSEWKSVIGPDYDGYRNHVHRMIQFCFALETCSQEEKQKITIAGAFHDIGIWVDDTMDYIPPSLPPAAAYLEKEGLESWSNEIELMIREHHKLREFEHPSFPLVELFRKGDLIDFSLGLIKCGLSKSDIDQVRSALPNAGFHWMLVKRAAKWFVRHPLDPAPMFKW